MSPRIYPHEKLVMRAGFPSLEYYRDGLRQQPLVVFVTGGGITARISYGHPEGAEQDFLAWWVREAGYPFLALSYPLDNPAFPTVHPDFSVRDWGEQIAESIADVVATQQLPREVVILAWSMAGRVAVPLADALKRQGCDIALFIAMVASPPFAFLPALENLTAARNGLADVAGSFTSWLAQSLVRQGQRAGHTLIPDQLFRQEFTGNLPVNLIASSLRWREGGFVPDVGADLADTRALDHAAYPPAASMTHGDIGDPRHALTDGPAWAFVINQALYARRLARHQDRLSTLPEQTWRRLVACVRSAATGLNDVMEGNHMFFVGQDGARATVASMEQMLRVSRKTCDEVERLLVDLA